MGRRLTDNVSSVYIEAANRLRPKHASRRVIVYVESYDDVLFWRTVFQTFESENLRFEVMLPSRTSLGKGKKLAMNNNLGPGMIACVDADYDFLMQRHSEASVRMLDNPYIFHTYVYAIESYQCYAPGLHEACVMATLNDREVLNLEEFMRQFSVIVWPLLVWSIWCYRHDYYKQFSIMDLNETLAIRDVNVYHPELTLDYIRRRVNKRVSWLQHTFPAARKDFEPLKQEILSLGVTPETAYMYIQGHTLFDNIVLPLLNPVCIILRRERENEIKRLACHEVQRQNEMSCYQHSVFSVDAMLRKGTNYQQSEPYQRLLGDLRAFCDSLQKVAEAVEE